MRPIRSPSFPRNRIGRKEVSERLADQIPGDPQSGLEAFGQKRIWDASSLGLSTATTIILSDDPRGL